MLAAVVHSSRTLHRYIHRRILPIDSLGNSPKKPPFLRDFFLWQTGHLLKQKKEKENKKLDYSTIRAVMRTSTCMARL